jgi:hypothetical protein
MEGAEERGPRKYIWFGKVEGKAAKLLLMTLTSHSTFSKI